MKSREDLLNEARQHIREMNAREVHKYLESGNDPVLLDIRGLDEWDMGRLNGALHLARGRLEAEVEGVLGDTSREVIVYCAGGVRSLLAGMTLREMGYENVVSMSGGYGDWEDAGLPAEIPSLPETEPASDQPDMLEGEIAHLNQVLENRKKRLAVARKS